eukprot:m.38739 g.38739  ORF g.38739 m.38739 type:complete len:529 (+) comp14670_c0_seq3:197-1783(+)
MMAMARSRIAVGVISALLAVRTTGAADPKYKTDKGVIIGTSDNFDRVIAKHNHVMVDFYAPWCSHCQMLEPELAGAVEDLRKEKINAKLMKVDVTAHEDLGTEYNISELPTLLYFRKGQHTEFEGARAKVDIVSFLRSRAAPPVLPTTVDSIEEADDGRFSNDVSVFGFFNKMTDSDAQAFSKAANGVGKIKFFLAFADNTELCSHFKVKSAPAILVFTDYDTKATRYRGKMTNAQDIAKFVNMIALPPVLEFTNETSKQIFGGDIKSHLLLFADKKATETTALMSAMTTAAAKYRGSTLFLFIDINKASSRKVADFFAITPAHCPAIRLMSIGKEMNKYAPSTDDISAESITAFVDAFRAGRLNTNKMSQETPPDWDKHPVVILTRENFEHVVYDETKHVLVEFYSPSCALCTTVEPEYTKLGKAYRNVKSIVIAKIDGTQNEIDEVHLHEYPTFKLFPKGKDKLARAVDYNVATDGERTSKNFAGFLKQHTRKVSATGTTGSDSKHGAKGATATPSGSPSARREEL